MQSPPVPAQSGSQMPLAQLPEQQSPFVLQQSSSYWQSGSVGLQEPPLLLPLPLLPPLLLPLLLALIPPPLPPPLPPLLLVPPVPVPHLPAVQESEQHWE
jgi:hypothetical protein